jgi:hypothetical protein
MGFDVNSSRRSDGMCLNVRFIIAVEKQYWNVLRRAQLPPPEEAPVICYCTSTIIRTMELERPHNKYYETKDIRYL